MKKKKYKIINIIVLIGITIFSSVATVYATKAIASNMVTYNNSTSNLTATEVQGAIDELYYKTLCANPTTLVSFLRALPDSSTVLQDDGSGDTNMRYIGANPDNYVNFNGEL